MTIKDNDGTLSVNASALDITGAINSPDLENDPINNQVYLKQPIKLSEVALRGEATTLKMPDNITFGTTAIRFMTQAQSEGQIGEYKLSLKKNGNNTFTAYIVEDNNSTGGVSFDKNFDTSTGIVSLKKNLVGIDSIANSDSSTILSIEDFSEIPASSDGYYVRVEQQGNKYALKFSKPSGGDDPEDKGSHGVITMIESPIAIAWNGIGEEGRVDARLQYSVTGQVYCSKKLLCPIGSDNDFLPYTDSTNNPERDGASFFDSVEPELLVNWNQSLFVLGRNNYANLMTS